MRRSLQLILLSFPIILLALVPCSYAKVHTEKSSTENFDVHIAHSVQVKEGGPVLINDTITLSTKPNEYANSLKDFSIGFPSQFGSNLDYCFAYDASNPNVRFDVELDVGLGRIGFYGVNVRFHEPINISYGGSYNFTVVFVFSNLLSSMTETSFKLDFPMYPSLKHRASLCYVSITLPSNANHTENSFSEKELDFKTINSRQVLNHTKSPLEDFVSKPAWLTFTAPDSFLLININGISREITLNEWGNLLLSDLYQVTNKAKKGLSKISVQLPSDAYDISAWDLLGELAVISEEAKATTYINTTVSFRAPLKSYEKGKFSVTYLLPRKNYVKNNWDEFNLTFSFFEHFDWTIRKLAVTIKLPEGAEFQSILSSTDPKNVQKSVFRETVSFVLNNVTPFHDLTFCFSYDYFVFWASFRPTLWVGILVVIFYAIALLWRAPGPPVSITPIPLEDLKSFINSYNKKRSLLSELESLEQQMGKRKLPRRQYKVRKKTLDGRLSVLSRNLTDLLEKIRRADPRYADIIRQIEVAETELEGVEMDIRRISARHRHRKISSSAYHKILDEYRRRRDRAKTTIDGALLRLREEIP